MLLSHKQIVTFDDTRTETGRAQICEFGKGENLTASDATLRARYEQTRPLSLPANAVLCDVQMTTDLQSFKYDDVFFFTFNGRILASNDLTAMNQKLTPESVLNLTSGTIVGLYNYDWPKLRTAPFKNVADDYCVGKAEGLSTCEWPISEQAGKIKFNFHRELLIGIGLKTDASNQKFGFVITGDNDLSLDCYHQELKFSMDVKYYLP